MRVYELAKKLGVENRDLIPKLKEMGIAVASHSSALDEAAVQKALDKLSPKAKATHEGEPSENRPEPSRASGAR